jgi:hypothetical protein
MEFFLIKTRSVYSVHCVFKCGWGLWRQYLQGINSTQTAVFVYDEIQQRTGAINVNTYVPTESLNCFMMRNKVRCIVSVKGSEQPTWTRHMWLNCQKAGRLCNDSASTAEII